MNKKKLDAFGELLIDESINRRSKIFNNIIEKYKGNEEIRKMHDFLNGLTPEQLSQMKWMYSVLLTDNTHDLLSVIESSNFTIAYKDKDKLIDLKEVCHEETDSYTLNAEFLEWMDKFEEKN